MNYFLSIFRREFKALCSINRTDRTWELPFAAALCAGLPIFIGTYFNHVEYGLISSLGGMIFLYTPNTPLYHRVVVLMGATTIISACFLIGLLSSLFPFLIPLTVVVCTFFITSICRYFRVQAPGSLFFIMALCIASNMKLDILDIPYQTGLIFLGALLASIVAFFYSIFMFRRKRPMQEVPKLNIDFYYVIIESIMIALFVGFSVVLAELLGLRQYYWVPISCLIVIQGITFRNVWDKSIHRLIGTTVGLFIAWFLLKLDIGNYGVAFSITILMFIVEFLIARHYAFATVFITPLTLFLAEVGLADQIATTGVTVLIMTRFLDIVLGCVIGLIGGYVIHKTKFRNFFDRLR